MGKFSDYLENKYIRLEVYPPSETEPDASLTIEEIMLNVARTGTTGLPTGPQAEYDDEEDEDYDDITINHPDKVEAQDYLLAHREKSRKIVKTLENFERRSKERAKREVKDVKSEERSE